MISSRTLVASDSDAVAPKPLFPRVFDELSRWGAPKTPPAASLVSEFERFLVDVEPGSAVRITAMNLEADLIEWLRAVGIEQGGWITVLRRAVFGGPIHLRCGSGGEFALDTALARVIRTNAGTRADAT